MQNYFDFNALSNMILMCFFFNCLNYGSADGKSGKRPFFCFVFTIDVQCRIKDFCWFLFFTQVKELKSNGLRITLEYLLFANQSV